MGEAEQTTVRVPLTVEQQADIGHRLAELVEQIKGVKAEAKSKAFAFREEIERLQDQQEQLSGQMLLGSEEKSQLDLFVGQDDAQRALHDVAKAACTCEGGADSDVKSPGCPVHGVDSPAAAKAREESDERIADAALAQEIADAAVSASEKAETPIGEQIDGGGEAA